MSAPTSSEGRDPAAPSPWVPDALASVVVFLVAVPLCIGIAVACGVPPERGLVTGIVGGIVVGSISGAPLLVSGPAASLIVPVFDLVQSRGLAALAPVVMLAGAWQALAGLSRLGQWFRAVAPAVIRGMLIGIGVLIFASQLHVAIDGDPRASFVENLTSFPGDEWKHVYRGRRSDRPEPMITERWIEADRVRARLASETIEGVLTEAALLLAPHAGVSEADLAARLIARAEGHIVLGDGVSLPHAPIEGLKRPIAAIVTTAAPIEVDGEPADVFFVLLAPEADPQAHLRALAQVGRLCHDPALLDRLRGAETAREVVAAIEDASASAADPEPPTRDGARLLAIVEVSRGRAGERLAELLAEAFRPALTLTRDDPSFGPLRRVIRAEEDHLLLVIPIEPRDTEVLETLVSEQARLTREAMARVHLLHPERVDAAPEALVAQSSMA